MVGTKLRDAGINTTTGTAGVEEHQSGRFVRRSSQLYASGLIQVTNSFSFLPDTSPYELKHCIFIDEDGLICKVEQKAVM